jgi:DinB superfamily
METITIKNALQNTLQIYKNSLSNYSPELFVFKKEQEIWSLGQMYEHLVMTANFFFFKNIKYCLEQRNGQIGGEKNEWGENVFKYNSFPPIKVKVPGNAPEPVAKTQNEYVEMIEKIMQQIDNEVDKINVDAGEYKTLHPVFGWHNAKEWFQSFEMHHRHHLRQKTELEGFLIEKQSRDQ